MVEQQIIDGQDVTVSYLTTDFEPASKADATLIKLRYPDGRIVWLTFHAVDHRSA